MSQRCILHHGKLSKWNVLLEPPELNEMQTVVEEAARRAFLFAHVTRVQSI